MEYGLWIHAVRRNRRATVKKTSREDSSTSKNGKESGSHFELLIVEEDSHTKSMPSKSTNAINANYAMKSGPSKSTTKLNENPFPYISIKGKEKIPYSKTVSVVSSIGQKQDHLSLKIKPSSLPNPSSITPKPMTIISIRPLDSNKKRGRIVSVSKKFKLPDDERGAPRKQKISTEEAHVAISGN
ncbi:conserved hypothetical protein [Ricinus communis]|uniref:Uncharacterized protein n=1 Tax=Ricinus communis TaxID=3988 RepID=B9T4W8_RICCO|nr:conserved hypothetical protein [Ricinus communis]